MKENKIKVCHITSVHSRYDVRIFVKECISLENNQFNVSLIVSDGFGSEIKNDISIYDTFKTKYSRILRIIKNYNPILKKAIEINADIYHFHDPELIPVGIKLKLIDKTVIYDVHEDMPRDILSKEWIPFFLRRIVSFFFEKYENNRSQYFDCIITSTPFIKRRFDRYNKKTVNINNFPILKEFNNSKLKPKKNQICYIGFLSRVRGLYEILDSLSYCDAKLILAGNFSDSAFETGLRNHRNWAKVNYLGYVNRETVNNILSESNIGFVTFHPIIYHFNSLPTKMFEYMAAGLPVIASHFPYWIQLLSKYNCSVFVDPIKPAMIGAAINDLLQDPEKAKQMGSNGKKAVYSCFNWELEEKKLLDIYHS